MINKGNSRKCTHKEKTPGKYTAGNEQSKGQRAPFLELNTKLVTETMKLRCQIQDSDARTRIQKPTYRDQTKSYLSNLEQ